VSQALLAAILAAAVAVDAARAELGRLDGAAGDGDHGMTMSIGARNVRRRFAAAPDEASDADLVRLVAAAMGDVGGAIGPLAGAALTALAADLEATAAAGSIAAVNPVVQVLAVGNDFLRGRIDQITREFKHQNRIEPTSRTIERTIATRTEQERISRVSQTTLSIIDEVLNGE
jgi:hypothetical protein